MFGTQSAPNNAVIAKGEATGNACHQGNAYDPIVAHGNTQAHMNGNDVIRHEYDQKREPENIEHVILVRKGVKKLKEPATEFHRLNNKSAKEPSLIPIVAENPPTIPSNNYHHLPSDEHDQEQLPIVYMAVNNPQIAAQLHRYLPEARVIQPHAADGDTISKAHGDSPVVWSTNHYLYTLDDSQNVALSTSDNDQAPYQDSLLETQRREETQGKQNSWVTIFSIWNTMMGTSILAMPWVFQQAGFATSILLIPFVAAIACYTGYLTISATEELKKLQNIDPSKPMDFTDACQYHLGKFGRVIAILFSQFALVGALIVYFVLLTNFLYNTGDYIYRKVTHDNATEATVITIWNKTYTDIICKNPPLIPIGSDVTPIMVHQTLSATQSATNTSEETLYHKLWSPTRTVPVWLLVILFPLISIRSPTFLGKFTALGTISVGYLFILVCIKIGFWNFNMDFSSLHPYKIVYQFRPTFASLTGVCSLAFFIHNALHTIMRNQRRPERNGRDIVIAFGFTTATYMIIGVLFFCAFPLAKSCIEDNFLNNLSTDIPVFIGRVGLLFQMLTVYPMVVYVLRVQIMLVLFKNAYPSFRHATVLHVVILGTGLTFAMLLPKIGTIIRFSGALCGLVYIFTLPPLISLLNKRIVYRRLATTNGQSAHKEVLHQSVLHGTSGQADTSVEGAAPLLQVPTTSSNQPTCWRYCGVGRLPICWYLRVLFCACIIFIGVANFVAQFVIFFTSSK